MVVGAVRVPVPVNAPVMVTNTPCGLDGPAEDAIPAVEAPFVAPALVEAALEAPMDVEEPPTAAVLEPEPAPPPPAVLDNALGLTGLEAPEDGL